MPSGADQSVFDLVAAVAALSGGSTLVMATRLGVRRNNVRGAWGVLTFTFKEALRTKWRVVFAVTFFLLAADLPLRILGEFDGVSAVVSQQGFPVLLVDSFPLVPLLALPFGAVSIVDDREAGTMQYLLSNPISKFDFFVGRVSGLLLATTTVIFAGFGGAAVLLYLSSAALLKTVLVLMLTAALLNAVMLALALIISEVTSRRATAVGAAIFVWLLLTTALGLDTLSYAVYWKASAAAALSLVFLDPLEASRIAAVEAAHLNQSQTFGQSDYLALHFLGSNLLSVAVVSVLAWFVGLTVLGFVVFSYQDGN
ncbi:MAG: ABC transporter permease subunit [Nitrososphaerota archaeon]|nr:ABC transporter permease subunit [Nitrososphaerota archaeon]